MKSNFVYTIFLVAGLAAALLVFYGLRDRKRFEEKVTLKRKDKIPYGTEVAYRTLPVLFPGASVSSSKSMPGFWDSLSMDRSRQAYICITPNFDPDEFEMGKIIDFVKAGNDVFVSSFELSYNAEERLIRNSESSSVNYTVKTRFSSDSLSLSLLRPGKKTWYYPGSGESSYFTRLDTSRALVLGEEEGVPDFIQLNSGRGHFFLHRAPLAFSNYFLLHKHNMEYYERAMSYLSPGINRIVWDEYFLTRRHRSEGKQSWFSVLMKYPGLSTAVIIGLLTLLVYALAEMRRKQRFIPEYKKPRNDSMDFVKTIGRLYYEKGDHKNLAKKMAAYFLEHVRSRYKIPTSALDEKFVKTLQFKTGVQADSIQGIVNDIKGLEGADNLNAHQLNEFYKKLENFYRTA